MHHTDRTIAAGLAAALVPLLLVSAGCEDDPLTAEEAAVTAASQEARTGDSTQNDQVDGENGPRVPFDEAQAFFEFNTTDDDLGFQMFLDAEGWKRFRLTGPGRQGLVEITAAGALAKLGITELRWESAEPSPAEVLALFPEGAYHFTGRTVEGDRLGSTAVLSHRFLPAPTFSPANGETTDRNATVVSWNAPEAERVEVIIENDDTGEVLDVIVSGEVSSLDVPGQFLRPGTEYKIEILAIGENGNRTIAESTFLTRE